MSNEKKLLIRQTNQQLQIIYRAFLKAIMPLFLDSDSKTRYNFLDLIVNFNRLIEKFKDASK